MFNMANPQHLKQLRAGVAIWNQWRKKQQHSFRPDLSEADLIGAELQGAFLLHADLNEAFLLHANLSTADLRYASLIDADLRQADLSGADLSMAYSLDAADLRGAKIGGGASGRPPARFPAEFNPLAAGALEV